MRRCYQIGSSNLPHCFNHSFQIIDFQIKELTKDDFTKVYFWFPKNKGGIEPNLGSRFEPKDSHPQAALIWMNNNSNSNQTGSTTPTITGREVQEEERSFDNQELSPSPSPMIVVDGNHRSTLYLSDKNSETIKVVIFQVPESEYSYYKELLHSNYLDCLYGHLKLEDLRDQHLVLCRNMFSSSSSSSKNPTS